MNNTLDMILPLGAAAVLSAAAIVFAVHKIRNKIKHWEKIETRAAFLEEQLAEVKDKNIGKANDQTNVKILAVMNEMKRIGFSQNEKKEIEQLVSLTKRITEAVATSYYEWNDTSHQYELKIYEGNNSIVVPSQCQRPGKGLIGSRYYERQPIIHKLSADARQMGVKINTLALFPFETKSGDRLGVLVVGFNGNGTDLETSISRAHIIFNLAVPELERLVLLNQLKRSSETDGMTSLFNRGFFERRFPLELERASQHHIEMALILIDVDYFKQINDTHGHDKGDEALIALAEIIIKNVRFRSNDCACRLGGDEFGLILPGANQEKAYEIALKISKEYTRCCEEKGFKGLVGSEERISSLSVGIATYPLNARTSGELYKAADNALYSVKRTTKGSIALAEAGTPYLARKEGQE